MIFVCLSDPSLDNFKKSKPCFEIGYMLKGQSKHGQHSHVPRTYNEANVPCQPCDPKSEKLRIKLRVADASI